ncbi:Zinc finger MYM-type protein 1 [Merluccius polli]|uniref:Zinc finger MYM-type protein 1 n=1 Tax=Merluccius polli TaxID=89951 RepID=A0AA47P2F1_MERPO|nr:Zinc finger MYM-type protein 1 [Merluccius polli]
MAEAKALEVRKGGTLEPQTSGSRSSTESRDRVEATERWFRDFPWLHYSSSDKGVLCFYCSKASNRSSFGKRTDAVFISAGFRNCKKALGKFSAHEKKHSHCHSVTVSAHQSNPVGAQLSSSLGKQQEEVRHCSVNITSSVQYLARQGQALRGHTGVSGNLYQLLKLRSEDDPVLKKWLTQRTTNYSSSHAQNEILNKIANTVIRHIANTIRQSVYDLVPHEEFIVLYRVSKTTGQGIANVAIDVLLRLNLPMTGLRGQSYNGASNMAGKYSGAQAILRREQPLALYVHCGAHCVNLITQAACSASPLTRDSLSWVHKLGILFGLSGKLKSQQDGLSGIRPLGLCLVNMTVYSAA